MVQVGYLKHDMKQHILTLYRSTLDFDKAGTPEMLRNYEVEYLSVIEDADKEDDSEFCFDHLVIKGELVVLVCEKDQNFKIFSGDDLSLVTNLYLSDKYPIQQNSQVKFHDITIIEHDPTAYIIFARIEVDGDDQEQFG